MNTNEATAVIRTKLNGKSTKRWTEFEFATEQLLARYEAESLSLTNANAKIEKLQKAIDSINTLSGRSSTGHGECECSYCLIHKIAYEAWRLPAQK